MPYPWTNSAKLDDKNKHMYWHILDKYMNWISSSIHVEENWKTIILSGRLSLLGFMSPMHGAISEGKNHIKHCVILNIILNACYIKLPKIDSFPDNCDS